MRAKLNLKLKRTLIAALVVAVILIDANTTLVRIPEAIGYHESQNGYDPQLFSWIRANVGSNTRLVVLSNDYVGEWLSLYLGYDAWSYPATIYVAPASYFQHSVEAGYFLKGFYSLSVGAENITFVVTPGSIGERVMANASSVLISFDSISFLPSRQQYETVPIASLNESSSPRYSQVNGSLGLSLSSKWVGMSFDLLYFQENQTVVETLQAYPVSDVMVAAFTLTCVYTGYSSNSTSNEFILNSNDSKVIISSPLYTLATSGNSGVIEALSLPNSSAPITIRISITPRSREGAGFSSFFLPYFASSNHIGYLVCSRQYCSVLGKYATSFGFPVRVYSDANYEVYKTG